MNQQQPAASSQPGASLYMGQRLEMEYLCAGAHRSHIRFRTIANLSSQQIVAQRTRSDLANRSAAENADTGSCTRNAPRGVSVFFCRRLLMISLVPRNNRQWSNLKRGRKKAARTLLVSCDRRLRATDRKPVGYLKTVQIHFFACFPGTCSVLE